MSANLIEQTKPEKFAADIDAEYKQPSQPGTDALESRLNELVHKFDNLTRLGRQARYYIWAQNALFAKAIQLFSFDPYFGEFELWDEEDTDMYCPVPLTYWAVEMLSAEYAKMKPKIVPYCEDGDRKKQATLDDLEIAAESKYSKFWQRNPLLRQNEAKLLIQRGCVYSRLWFDKTQGRKVQVPRMAESQKTLPGAAMCADCDYTGEEATEQCPECGSTNIQSHPPVPVQSVSVEGYDDYHEGEANREVVDPMQVEVYDRRLQVEDSPYLIYDDLPFRQEIKKELPWVNVEDYQMQGNFVEGFSGLHFKQQIDTLLSNSGELDQSQSYNLTRYAQLTNELTCWRRRVWIDKWVYEDTVVPRDTKIPGSEDLIPKGTKLGDAFPDGLMIYMVNDRIVALRNEDKNKVWAHCKYTTPDSGFYSPGISPVINLNKGYDELGSIRLQAAVMSSLGITIVDERLKSVSNQPGTMHVVQDRRHGEALSEMVHHVQTPGLGPEVAGQQEQFKENLVDLSSARNPNTSGLTGQGMRTATGVNYQQETANAIASPKLELYAAYQKDIVEKAIALELQYGVTPRFYSKFGETHGRWINPWDIPREIKFRVEEDSHQPRTQTDIKTDTAAAMGLGWGTGKLSPTAEEQVGKIFRMPTGAEGYKDWATKAEKRLDAMKEVAKMLEQLGANSPTLPLEIITKADALPKPMDNHGMMGRFFMEIYLSDEFDKMSPAMQAAIQQLFQLHQIGGAEQQANQMTLAKGAMEPVEKIDDARETDKQARQQAHDKDMASLKAKQKK